MINAETFVKATVFDLSNETFNKYKNMLLGEYINFSFFKNETVNNYLFAEKIIDYFSALEPRTFNTFDKQIEKYIDTMLVIVEPRIALAPKPKKSPLSENRADRCYGSRVKIVKLRRRTRTTPRIDSTSRQPMPRLRLSSP